MAGASVAAVAQSNALNANLVHQWRRGRGFTDAATGRPAATPSFVALALPPSPDPASPERAAERLGGADAPPAGRRCARGQQPLPESHLALDDGNTGMAVCRQRVGQAAHCGGDEFDPVGQAQWARPLGLSQGRTGTSAHPSEQPHQRAASSPLATTTPSHGAISV